VNERQEYKLESHASGRGQEARSATPVGSASEIPSRGIVESKSQQEWTTLILKWLRIIFLACVTVPMALMVFIVLVIHGVLMHLIYDKRIPPAKVE
jgi:hypothetical protein